MMSQEAASRFWSKVDKSGPCWLWQGYRTANGYGRHWFDSKTWWAHRLAFMLATGNDPGALFVCHRCDNPACVNPAHLFLGRPVDNSRDSVSKLRHTHGARNSHARLSESDVRAIRTSGEPRAALAERFGVRVGAIGKIVTRKAWRYVDQAH